MDNIRDDFLCLSLFLFFFRSLLFFILFLPLLFLFLFLLLEFLILKDDSILHLQPMSTCLVQVLKVLQWNTGDAEDDLAHEPLLEKGVVALVFFLVEQEVGQ